MMHSSVSCLHSSLGQQVRQRCAALPATSFGAERMQGEEQMQHRIKQIMVLLLSQEIWVQQQQQYS
jgi:hypothetical protein